MGSMFASRGRVVAAVAAVVLGVGMAGGCGDGSAEPKDKDWSEGDQSEKDNGKQQAGDDEPAEPEEPEEYTFVKEYIDAINEVKKGGDTSTLLDMSTDDCRGCDVMAQYHEDMYANGGKYIGDPTWRNPQLVGGPKGTDPTIVRVKVEAPEVDVVEEKGGPKSTIGGTDEFNEFELVKEGGEWKVAETCGVTENQPSGCS